MVGGFRGRSKCSVNRDLRHLQALSTLLQISVGSGVKGIILPLNHYAHPSLTYKENI